MIDKEEARARLIAMAENTPEGVQRDALVMGANSLAGDIAIQEREEHDKQIPKVPIYSGDGYYNGEMVIDTWECPCCGKQYEVDYDDYKYCPNCGQHIDHSTLMEDD